MRLSLLMKVAMSLCLLIHQPALSQNKDPGIDKVLDFPSSFFNNVSNRIASLDDQLTKQTEKYLSRLAKREKKLKKKLYAKDSTLAKSVFFDTTDQYAAFITKLQHKSFHIDPRKAGDYLPNVDSLNMLLRFVQKGSSNPTAFQGATGALQSMRTMQDKLIYIQEIRKYIKNRKGFLAEQLKQHGFSAQLKRFNKDAYYYGQVVKEYKSMLNDPSKLEQTALRLLQKVPAFKDFAAKNSFLNSLFGSTDMLAAAPNNGTPAIPGLQTRNDVTQVVNITIMTAGQGSQDMLSQQLLVVKNELRQLQSKVSQWDDDAELPDFKPNTMKSKSLMKRLEFGTNLQFGKANSFVPSSADIAAQVAYKFHQNGSAGLGASYKLGFGSLRAVSFSHQGIGFRSFMDYKLKGSFYVNGGMEYNYNAAFKSIEQLRSLSSWQSSALLGLSKKYTLSKKIKGNLVVLYDFLHKQHTPNTQAIVFRFGYNF